MTTELKPDLWTKMNFDDLLEQRDIMNTRYNYLLQKNPKAAVIIYEGIMKLESLINTKL